MKVVTAVEEDKQIQILQKGVNDNNSFAPFCI